jgi:predicted transcriptional regulator
MEKYECSPSLDVLKELWGYKSKSTVAYYIQWLVSQGDLIIMPNEGGRVNERNQYLITPQGLDLAKAAQND